MTVVDMKRSGGGLRQMVKLMIDLTLVWIEVESSDNGEGCEQS